MNHSITTDYYTPRLITKLGDKVTELDDLHGKINDVYANGAVEGYSEQSLGPILQKSSYDHPAIPK